MEKDDVSDILRHLSSALLSTERNNLDSCNQVTSTSSIPVQNNINCTEYFSTDGNLSSDVSPMSTDSESCDSESEADMDYQEELLSRMRYYGQYENSMPSTPSKKPHLSAPISNSTPEASSTMIEDCTQSMLRNNQRRKSRSEPLASSTMMEDLLAEVQCQTESDSDQSFVVWSIENTETASLKYYYNRYFGLHESDLSDSDSSESELSTGLWMHTKADLSTLFNADDSFTLSSDSEIMAFDMLNGNGTLPRTSTCTDLEKAAAGKKEKKKSKGKLPGTKLWWMIRSIKKSLTKKTTK